MSSSNGTTTGTARSRLKAGHAAVRKAVKARLAISGASGAGKTWTALSVAEVLTDGPVLVIDTEPADSAQGAAELYADRFSFDTIRWVPLYDPRDLALTIREAGSTLVPGSRWAEQDGGYDLIIVDSASHFWRGEGGTLDIAGGTFGGWREATPIQDDLVQAILTSSAHIICCTRAKMDYQVEQESGGKQKVTKLGLAPIQRDDLEYEFQVVALMDHTHTMEVTKTRCAALAGQAFRQNDQARFAHILKEWLEGGVELITQGQVDQLVALFSSWEELEARTAVKQAFLEVWGAPVALPAEKWDEALEWVTSRVPQPEAKEEPPQLSSDAVAEPEATETPPEEPEATTAISRARQRAAQKEPAAAEVPAEQGALDTQS
jgi:hypothetical protein